MPIDRTAKTALDSNLVNGNTSDAPKIKTNNDVIYNFVDGLEVADGTHAGNPVLAHPDQSVTTAKMKDGAVTNVKYAPLSITGDKIAAGTIDATKFVAGSLTNETQNALRITEHDAQLADIAINVKHPPVPIVAAVGDGVTDDTAAIQATINASGSDGSVIIPDGTFVISSTIIVNPGVTLVLSPGAVIKQTTNNHAIQLKALSVILGGGTINVSEVTAFSSACVYINTDDYNKPNYSGYIRDLSLKSASQRGYGIYIYSKQPVSGNSFIQYMTFDNIVMSGLDKGLYINAEDVPGNTGWAWANGLTFDKLYFNTCAWGIYQYSTNTIDAMAAGNRFTNIQYQCGTFTQGAYYIGGSENVLTSMIWDINNIVVGTKVIQLPSTSSHNRIETNLGALNNNNVIQDLGKNNTVVNPNTDTSIQVGQYIKFPVLGSDQYLPIATLPVSSGSTLDKLLIKMMGGPDYNASSGLINDWVMMGNRGGFSYESMYQGNAGLITTSQRSNLRIRAYSQVDGTVKVYLYCLANKFTVSMIQVLGIGLGIESTNIPLNMQNVTTTVPSGTLVFDSYTNPPNGHMQIASLAITGRTSALPTASADYENQILLLQGNGTTTASTLHICLKSSTGTYSWKQIISG